MIHFDAVPRDIYMKSKRSLDQIVLEVLGEIGGTRCYIKIVRMLTIAALQPMR